MGNPFVKILPFATILILFRYSVCCCYKYLKIDKFLSIDDRNKHVCHCSWFESHRIWAAALVVGEICETPSHWRQTRTLSKWMKEQNIPGIYEIDTRALTKIIREKGTILGRIVFDPPASNPVASLIPPIADPNSRHLVAEVVQVHNNSIYSPEFDALFHFSIFYFNVQTFFLFLI